MTQNTGPAGKPDVARAEAPARPKWFAPGVFALAFTLSFIGAEVLGPLGAVLGLVAGAGAGWAATRWVFESKDPS